MPNKLAGPPPNLGLPMPPGAGGMMPPGMPPGMPGLPGMPGMPPGMMPQVGMTPPPGMAQPGAPMSIQDIPPEILQMIIAELLGQAPQGTPAPQLGPPTPGMELVPPVPFGGEGSLAFDESDEGLLPRRATKKRKTKKKGGA